MSRHPSIRIPGRVLHAFFRTLEAALLLVLLAGGWAALFGLPRPLIARVEEQFRAWQVDLHIGGIYWRWPLTLLAEHIDYRTSDGAAGDPLISVERLAVDLRPLDHWRGLPPVRTIRARNGVIRLPAYEGDLQAGSPANLRLSRITGSIRLHPDLLLEFENMTGNLQGIPFRTTGTFQIPPEFEQERTLLDRWQALYAEGTGAPPPGWLADLVTAFSESRFDPERNRIEATFMIDPTSRARNRVVLHAGGTDMRTRGLAITNWQAELSLEDGLFLATNVFFEQPGGRLSGAASHDFDGDSLEIRLESDWPPEHHLALLPAPLAAIPAEWGFSWEGPAALAVQTGPASRTNPLGRVQAQIKQRDLRFRDIPLYHVDIHAEWDGDTLWIHHAEGEAPPNAPGGICSATAAIHPASKAYAVRFAAQLLPHMLHPVCSGGLNRFISRFEFPEHAPQASGLITGRWGEEHSYNCRGRIRGEQFIMNDVTLIDLSADLEINKRELALKDIHATRQEGVLYGHLTLPMNRDEAAFNLHSAMNPNAVLELISPDLAELLAPIEFRGESSVVASGEMDYLIRTQMLFQVEVKATGVDVFGVLFDTTLFAVEGRGDEYLVRDFQGRLLEGAATGEARFFPVDESAYRYNLEMAYSNLSVAGLMSLFDANQPTNAPPLPAKKGKARGSLLLSGTTATNWLSQMVARGNIHVDEGPILSIPLFGPLSRWLSQIAPTLGYLTQTDFDAGIDLHDGKLHLDNARLQGATISIGLDGHYDLATEELDFRVQIRFLRDGIFARIINLVTYPLTKLLLEFHLGGTLAEPDWRPVNVPKELYFDFD